MTERAFREAFTKFLHDYWGAFHEALEAQSVTPQRLAESLFEALQAEHARFEAVYAGPAKGTLEGLSRIWQGVRARRVRRPDATLTQADVAGALGLFGEIYDSLVHEGEQFPEARQEVLTHAPHGSPREPLRADSAR